MRYTRLITCFRRFLLILFLNFIFYNIYFPLFLIFSFNIILFYIRFLLLSVLSLFDKYILDYDIGWVYLFFVTQLIKTQCRK